MAILDFPSSPTPGQIHTQNGKTWRWDASLNTWKSYNILGIQSGGTGLSGINAADAFLSSLNPVGLGLTYRQLIAGSGINIALTPSTVTFTSTGGGGAGNGTVDYGNTYEIPYYPSTGILVTGSPYFHNVGTGISILFNTPSISSKTGALTINGGVGIGGSLFVAGTASSISGIIINNSVITSGSWAGSTITMLYGGTGYASNNKGDILVGTGQSWFKLSYSASANDVLTVDTSTASGLKWAPVPPASASSVSVKSDNTAGPFYITFVNATDGSGLALSTDSNLSYNASTNALTASTFIGNLTGTASTATYADQSGFAITAGLATTATYSHQSGFASTSGLATTSSNIYLRQATENSDFYVTLSKNISGSGIALSAGSGLTFNPFTNTLSATSIIGTLLTANQPNITGVGTVISGVWSATAITSRYGGTGFTSYNKGDLLVGNGSSTLVKVPVGNTNDILIGSTFSGYGVSWVTLSPVYGAFASTNTQQVIAANTGTAVSFNSVFESNRVSLSTSGVGYSTRIYVHEPGVYNFQFSAQVDTVTTNQLTKGEFWFKKNGVDVPDSNSLLTINGKDDENILALNFVSTILPDEYVELYFSSDKSDFRLLSLENLTSPARPNIPSVIFTVTPVSNILPSTGIAISGIASINNETGPYQSLIVGSSGNDFVISSSSNTHTFNLPSASATARGLVTTTTQTFAGDKTFTGIVNATNITDSTSTTTGAAIVTGGLGVGGNAFIGGTVTAQLFTGNLSATAATATNFYGNLIGTATTATYAHQSGFAITAGLATTANYSHQSGFAITAGLATTATYSHQSGYAITSGLATTATYAHQSGFAVTAGLATTAIYAHQSGYAITSGLATTATYSHQSGFAITAGLATTSTNINVASSGSTDSSHFLLFSRFNIGSGLAVSSAIGLSYTPSTGVLIGTTFQGNLQGNVLGNLTGTASTATYAHQSGYAITSGLATTSTNVNVVSSGSTSSSHFLLFTRFNAGTGLAVSSATGLSYIPSTGVLIGTTFQGNLQGNVLGDLTGTASTATYAHQSGYAITSGSATTASYAHQSGYAITTGTATTASNTNLVLNTSATANHPITFTPSTTTVSGGAQSFSTSVYIIPSSGTIVANALAASGITIGSATNTISTASGDLTLTSATNLVKVNNNLTIAGNLVVNGDTTSIGTTISTLLDPIFVLGAGVGGTSPSIDDNKDRGIEFRYFSGSAKTGFFGFDDSTGYFTFIPDGLNTNEVFSGTAGTAQFTTVIADLSGTASTATYSHQSGYAITSGLATTANYSHQSGFALTSGLATTATYSHQSGFAITSGFATTSYNISIANATTNQSHRIVFAPNSSLSGSALSSGATLLYNPSTDTLQTGKLLASSGQSARFYNVTSLSSGYDAALYVEGGLAVSNNIAVRRNVLIGSTYPANINSLQGAVGATFIRIVSPEFGYNGMGVQFWDGQATSATDPTFALVTSAGGSRSPGLSWSGSGNSTDLAIFRDNTNALNISVLDPTRGTLYDRLIIGDNNGQGTLFTFGFASAGNSRNIRFATVSPVSGTDLNGGEWRFIGLQGRGNGTPGTFLFSTGDRDAANPTTAHSTTTAFLIDEFGVIVGSSKGTNSTSITTGTARINGGLGVTGNAFIGGTVNIQNPTSSTGISSGALVVRGGVGISGNTFIGGNLSVWNGNELRLFQSNNVNYSGLKYTGGSNTPYILPTAYPGTATSFLTSDTNGNMFWIAAPSASSAGTVDQGTAFAIPYYPSAGSLVTGSSSFTNIVGSGISILYVTNSVSNSTGALVVSGGVGISGNAFIGGTVTASVFYGNIVGSGATITNIYGTLTGSATSSGFATTAGLATTAQNVNVASVGNTNTDHFLFFGRFATGTGLAVSSAIGLSYNPSTGIISGNAFIGTSVSASNFYGNLSGTAVTATNFYGTFNGTATTSTSINLVSNSVATANHPITFTPSTTNVSGGAQSFNTNVYVIPSGGIIVATGFTGGLTGNVTGNLTGTATTSQNVNVAASGTTDTPHFLVFSRFASGSGLALSTDSTINFNPTTEILSVSGISITSNTQSTSISTGALQVIGGVGITGNIYVGGTASSISGIQINSSVITSGSWSGSAVTMTYGGTGVTTNAKGDLLVGTGQSWLKLAYSANANDVLTVDSTTASGLKWASVPPASASSVSVKSDNTAGPFYLTFVNATDGSGLALSTDTTLTYNSLSNILSLGTGSLAANGVTVGLTANTISTATGDLTLSSATNLVKINNNLTISGNLIVNGDTTSIGTTISTLLDPIFVLGAGIGGTNPDIDDNKDRGIEFRYFSGTAKTGFFGFDDSTGYFTFIPDGLNNSEVFSGTAGTAQFTTVIANLTGFANTAFNLNTVNTSSSSTHYLTFSLDNGGSGVALSSSPTLQYVPSTSTLSASNFSGTLTGNVTGNLTGIATTATNVNVASSGSTNTSHFLLFSRFETGTGLAVSSATGLSYTPSTGVLIGTTFQGNLQGNVLGNVTGTATTATNVNLVSDTVATANNPLIFTPSTSTVSGGAQSFNANVYIIPSGGIIVATGFTGGLTGNVTGTATTATYANQSGYAITSGLASTSSNISIGSATANASHWLTFTPNQSLSGSAISTNTNLTYNPSTDTISATNLILNGTQAGGSNTTGALRVQGGVAISGYLVANEFIVGISTVAVTNFNRWVTRHGGTRPDFTFYTGTNANPVIRLSDSFAAQHANQFPGIEFNGFSSQSFNTFGVGVGIAERNGVPVGNGISTLALFTSNGTAQVIRLSIPGGGSIGSTNLIIFGSSTSSNPNVTILRGVDANGTDANSGDFVIQPGRSTGSGSVGGIRFLLANPSTSGSTLNTPLDTVKFNPIQNSSSTTTGTVNIYGGLGLTGNAFIGGTVNIKNTTASIGISSGALVIDGGVGVGGTLNIGGNANIRSGYELRIFESGNSIYSGFKYTGGSNTPYILPTAYPGAATSFLTSDTSGNMYWIAAPSGGSGNPAGDNTQVQFNNSGSFGATSFFTYSNLTDTLTLSGNSITSPNLVITKTIADMGSTTPGIRLINNKVATGFTDLYSPKFEFLNGNYSAGSSKTTTFYLQTRTDSTLPGSNIFEIKYTNPNIGNDPVTLLQGFGFTNGDLFGGYVNFGVHGLIVQKQQNSASNYATGLYIGPNNDGFAGLAPVSFILSSAGSDGIDNVQVRARQFVNTPTNNGDYTWNLEIGPQTFGVNYPPIHSDDTTYTSVITATAVGSVIIQQAIDSYDSTSGALVVNGGFGLAGSAFIGGTITTANITNSSSTNSGAVVIAGGAGVGESLSIGGRLQLFNGANYTAFLSSATSSTTYILPPTAPVVAAGSGISVLSSNNTGTMSWVRVASGFGSANRLARYNSSGFGFTESIISDTLGTGAGISIVPTRALTGSGIAQSSVLTIYSHITDDGGAASAGNSRFFHIRTFRSSGAESFAVANNGFLRARVKAFDIEHPSKPNKRLIHGCLEGPENGVYVRGTVEGKGPITIEFPEYWVPLTRDDYTVYLTPHGNYTVSIKEKNINSFTIQLNGNKYINRNKFYKVDYYAIANRKDVDFILEEDDINKKKF